MSNQIILSRMEHLTLETKAIIFAVGFVAVIIIGLIMDALADKKNGPRYVNYTAEYSCMTPTLMFLWCVGAGLILCLI